MGLLSVKAHFLFVYAMIKVEICRKTCMDFCAKECDRMEKCRSEDMPLSAPNAEGSVWPKQVCPVFEPRVDTPKKIQQCWYCRCADFHLDKPKALDVGVCYWPKKITK
jgi:hypothetical protein